MKRVLTGLVLVPIFVYIVIWSPVWVFFPAVAAVAMLLFHEYNGLVAAHNFRPSGIFGYVAGLLVLFVPRPEIIFVVLIALLVLALSLSSRDLSEALPFASALLLGVIYCFGTMRTCIGLRDMSPYWLLFGLSLNWIGDIAAFYVGRSLGRHKLAPRVSPAKSWEGAVASTLMSVAYAYVYFPRLLPSVPLLWALGIAAAGNVAGQVGDLCESALKRGAGVKDSGTMLPGHGGWLDRVDSSLFALPVVYYIASVIQR